MRKNGKNTKIALFTCNWQAYRSLEAAGFNGKRYSSNVVPIRLSCLGRITPGLILKAFENGAKAVCLAGCPEGGCQFQSGNLEAKKVVEESKELVKLLGYNDQLIMYSLLPADDGARIVEMLEDLVRITENEGKQ